MVNAARLVEGRTIEATSSRRYTCTTSLPARSPVLVTRHWTTSCGAPSPRSGGDPQVGVLDARVARAVAQREDDAAAVAGDRDRQASARLDARRAGRRRARVGVQVHRLPAQHDGGGRRDERARARAGRAPPTSATHGVPAATSLPIATLRPVRVVDHHDDGRAPGQTSDPAGSTARAPSGCRRASASTSARGLDRRPGGGHEYRPRPESGSTPRGSVSSTADSAAALAASAARAARVSGACGRAAARRRGPRPA